MVVETLGQGTAFVPIPAGLTNGGVTFVMGVQPEQVHSTEADAIQYGLKLIEEQHAQRCAPIMKALAAAQSRRS